MDELARFIGNNPGLSVGAVIFIIVGIIAYFWIKGIDKHGTGKDDK